MGQHVSHTRPNKNNSTLGEHTCPLVHKTTMNTQYTIFFIVLQTDLRDNNPGP